MASNPPPAQARFYLDREGEANLLARDVGRIFLGMDLQCAQCHDHPLIADYYQADYQGLYAFFNRSILFTDKDKKVFFAEKADGDVAYVSVFDATRKGTALPQLPGGEPVPEPSFDKGQEYVVAPADNVPPDPQVQPPRAIGRTIDGKTKPLLRPRDRQSPVGPAPGTRAGRSGRSASRRQRAVAPGRAGSSGGIIPCDEIRHPRDVSRARAHPPLRPID